MNEKKARVVFGYGPDETIFESNLHLRRRNALIPVDDASINGATNGLLEKIFLILFSIFDWYNNQKIERAYQCLQKIAIEDPAIEKSGVSLPGSALDIRV